jgi:hypothetical protein
MLKTVRDWKHINLHHVVDNFFRLRGVAQLTLGLVRLRHSSPEIWPNRPKKISLDNKRSRQWDFVHLLSLAHFKIWPFPTISAHLRSAKNPSPSASGLNTVEATWQPASSGGATRDDVNRSRLVTGLGGEDNTAISTFGVVLSGKTTSSFPSFLSCLGFLFLHALVLVWVLDLARWGFNLRSWIVGKGDFSQAFSTFACCNLFPSRLGLVW